MGIIHDLISRLLGTGSSDPAKTPKDPKEVLDMSDEREPKTDQAIDPPSNDGGGTAPVGMEAPNDEPASAIDPPSNDGGN